tara:strand:- start:3187 stop:3969 length:783 start_codon:yes stop_codon:yes gene_type:complete
MYDGFFYKDGGMYSKNEFYGKGFSLYGYMEDIKVDRLDIEQKIKSKFYDFIIYSSPWMKLQFFNTVSLHYENNKIIFIDGHDSPKIRKDLLGRGIYFKREKEAAIPLVKHIGYSFPAEKIISEVSIEDKKRVFSICDPRDSSTYIYNEEKDYFNGYKESWFGYTQKKGGWDCLRHYEILSNGCLPFFKGVDNIPPEIMVFFPKYECREILYIGKQHLVGLNIKDKENQLIDLSNLLLKYTKRKLCCTAMAKYLLSEMKNA